MIEFIKRNFRWLVGGLMLTYFSTFGQTYFISASVAEWQVAFGLSHGEFGRLYMFATLASAICLPFVGRLVDVVQPHNMIILVIPVLSGAAVLAGHASSLPVLFIAIFALRLFGQGMMTHMALTATARWFVAERGRAVSLVVLGHQGGEATVPMIFAALTIAYGYRVSWFVAAALLLIVALPITYWCFRKPRVPHGQVSTEISSSPAARSWTRREVLKDPVFWVLLTGVLGPAFIGTSIFYHQDYMTALNGWPAHLFASCLLLLALTSVVVALIFGAVIDRFSAVSVLPFFLLPLCAACFVLANGGSQFALYITMILLGTSYGISSTLFGALWPEIYGLANLGAVRSVTVSAMVLATAIGPGLTGTLIDRGIDLPAQMVFFAVYCLLAAGAMTSASMVLRRRLSPIVTN